MIYFKGFFGDMTSEIVTFFNIIKGKTTWTITFRAIYIYIYIYDIHFELRIVDFIWKVGPSGIRTHDLVLTMHTL